MSASACWEAFFTAAGLPRRVSLQYARLFVEQRIQETMLDDIDKATLVDLGITTIGDQIAILRHIRARKTEASSKDKRSLAAGNQHRTMRADQSPESSRAAPDRHDIYHIHMPTGSTPKTRAIMQQNQFLRTAGVLKRGLTGVRQSGKDVLPAIRRNAFLDPVLASEEVSSTTNNVYDRLGVQGMVSDLLPLPQSLAYTALRPSQPAAYDEVSSLRRALRETRSEPVFRVRIPAQHGAAANNGNRVRQGGARQADDHAVPRVAFGGVRRRPPISQRLIGPSVPQRPRPTRKSVFSRLG